jgi:hypothetical protein
VKPGITCALALDELAFGKLFIVAIDKLENY